MPVQVYFAQKYFMNHFVLFLKTINRRFVEKLPRHLNHTLIENLFNWVFGVGYSPSHLAHSFFKKNFFLTNFILILQENGEK